MELSTIMAGLIVISWIFWFLFPEGTALAMTQLVMAIICIVSLMHEWKHHHKSMLEGIKKHD